MPSIGQRLAGRYRLDARIGSGAFATVFRARDLRLERDVAVKILLASHALDPTVAARFEREALVLAAISHPNVVAIHDVEPGGPSTGSEPFFVMDLCAGGSLADHLAASRTGFLSPEELIPILIDVAAGLEALHARGIVHRDLKPSNILLAHGRAQIADLGIAAAGPSELTAIGTTVGTLAYLAPEQLSGRPASPASDVHALGAVAFLGLTGRLPGAADSVAAVVAASARPADPVSIVAPGLGTAFDRALGRALARDPAVRPTADEFGQLLSTALARWRARPAPSAAKLGPGLEDLGPGIGSGSAAGATTIVGIPAPRRRPASRAGAGRQPPSHARARWPTDQRPRGAALGVIVAVVLLGSAALFLSRGPGGGAGPSLAADVNPSPTPSSSLTPSTPPSPSPSPSASPTPSPTPTPTPTPTDDPYAVARTASSTLRTVIASRGPGGLSGHDAKDLDNQLDRVDQALDQEDAQGAQDAANRLESQIADLTDRNGFDPQLANELRSDAAQLVDATNALPD
jgi:eukaryotic-like serine/threonine-protein kinase